MNAKQIEDGFDKWWESSGKYYDPDTDDVPWFDKRKELASVAFFAGHIFSSENTPSEEVIDTTTHGDVPEKEITLCKDCYWCKKQVYPCSAPFAPDYFCSASRVGFVSDSTNQFALCSTINTDGDCKKFLRQPEPNHQCQIITDADKAKRHIEFWQQIKKFLNR
jgi:hypothetical protein